jgi:hypothetical protein
MDRTIADQQAEFDQWYGEWLGWDSGKWGEKTPESLLSYFKARLCLTTHDLDTP